MTYGDYVYPAWCQGLGWCVALLSIMCMPIGAIHTLATSKGSMKDVSKAIHFNSALGPFILHFISYHLFIHLKIVHKM